MDINWNSLLPIISIVITTLVALSEFFGRIITNRMRVPIRENKEIIRVGFEFVLIYLVVSILIAGAVYLMYKLQISIIWMVFLILLCIICAQIILIYLSNWWKECLFMISIAFWYLFANYTAQLYMKYLVNTNNLTYGLILVTLLVILTYFVLKKFASVYGAKLSAMDIFVEVLLDEVGIISGVLVQVVDDFVILYSNGRRMMINKERVIWIREQKFFTKESKLTVLSRPLSKLEFLETYHGDMEDMGE